MTEVLEEIPNSSSERSPSRLRKKGGEIVGSLAVMSTVLTVIYGIGALKGNAISDKPDVDVRLEQILKPKAVKIAQQVLETNMRMNNNIVITKPYSNGDTAGEETVSISSITANNEWITIDASMYRDKQGQLDPRTVNDVDIQKYECDPPGPKGMCGGPNHLSEEIELIYGDKTTYTKGDWGVEDDLWLPKYSNPVITINTQTKNPTEISNTKDALHAVNVAEIFSKGAVIWAGDALAGKIDIPKPKKTNTV